MAFLTVQRLPDQRLRDGVDRRLPHLRGLEPNLDLQLAPQGVEAGTVFK